MSEHKNQLLIVEDEKSLREVYSKKLDRHFACFAASDVKGARDILKNSPLDAVLLDVRLSGDIVKDGLELLKEIKGERSLLPVVVMTAFGDIETAVEAMKLGADDFIEKGKILNPSEFAPIINAAIKKNREQLQINARLAEQQLYVSSSLIGDSKVLEPVRKAINLAAADGYCSVLLLGDSGTGKEVIARSIHEQSWRKEGPFVATSITSLNSALVESELFGHVKGAFTGATSDKTGYIERAHGGILFLDEIGEVSPEIQAKLLRFLEDKKVIKVGDAIGKPVEVQIVYATNRNLKQMVVEGKFRNDLYYRIKTVEVISPPLRDRLEDVPLLADHFLQMLRKQGRTKLTGFSPKAIEVLKQYSYPGNVRELRNIVEWSVLVAAQQQHWSIELEDLPEEIKRPSKAAIGGFVIDIGDNLNVDRSCAIAELACVERALKATRGQKGKAESLLGYNSRHTMRRRIQKIKESYPEIWETFPITAKFYDSLTIEDNAN